MHILRILGVSVRLTPICHPEIAGRGIEYAWEYSKLQFRFAFNNGCTQHLWDNIKKSLDQTVLTTNRILKYARKAREYKKTYHLLSLSSLENDALCKTDIEQMTKVFKVHRSAIDVDHAFISNS